MEPRDTAQNATLDYEQTLAYFHSLHDTRFKLLGLIPTMTGVAVAVAPEHMMGLNLLALACLGFVVTLGLVSYDQRNTQIYDMLVCRARFLEKHLGLAPLPGAKHGGAFHCRPALKKWLGVRAVWHIQGLILVYASSATGWVYLGILALQWSAAVVAVISSCFFLAAFLVLHHVSRTHYRETRQVSAVIELL